MYTRLFLFTILAALNVTVNKLQAQNINAKKIILQMIDSANNLHGFTSVIRKTERIEGKLILQVSQVKVSRNPYQVYVKQLAPKAGVEILCADGCKKALINMNGFPWINLSLDPYGMTMRRHQHHTVHDSGFDLLTVILSRTLKEFDPQKQTLILKNDSVWLGESVYNIEMLNHDYTTRPYIVNDSENIADIATKFNVNEYAILELNPECDDYEDVRSGQELLVPSHYGKKMMLYISKKSFLPVLIRVYDAKGLFEEYDYTELQTNPHFAVNEFDESFPDYNF